MKNEQRISDFEKICDYVTPSHSKNCQRPVGEIDYFIENKF